MVGAKKRSGSETAELQDGTVTAVSVKGAHAERAAVYLDGQRAFDISAVVAEEAGLRKGDVLTAERQVELLREDEPYRAKDAALKMLSARERPSAEVASKLRSTGIREEQIEAVVAWLQDLGYVDDMRYAAAYTATKTQSGWGRRKIATELYRKGVDRGVVDEAWQTWAEQHRGQDAPDQLIALVQKRFGNQLITDPEGARRRMSGFLARRGHDWETIAAVLRAVSTDDDPTVD